MNINYNTQQKQEAKNMCEDVCELLSLTNDGNKLAPKHLSLVQLVVNGDASDYGITEFYKILNQAREGKYDAAKVWFHNIENMTTDSIGYVYYKGIHIDHFSYRDRRAEKIKVIQLAERCKALEAKGIEVSCGNAIFYLGGHFTVEEINEFEAVLEIDAAELISRNEFLKINTAPDVQPMSESDMEIVKGLHVGQTAILGGGAVAIVSVHRLA
jgi:hypothetical protein